MENLKYYIEDNTSYFGMNFPLIDDLVMLLVSISGNYAGYSNWKDNVKTAIEIKPFIENYLDDRGISNVSVSFAGLTKLELQLMLASFPSALIIDEIDLYGSIINGIYANKVDAIESYIVSKVNQGIPVFLTYAYANLLRADTLNLVQQTRMHNVVVYGYEYDTNGDIMYHCNSNGYNDHYSYISSDVIPLSAMAIDSTTDLNISYDANTQAGHYINCFCDNYSILEGHYYVARPTGNGAMCKYCQFLPTGIVPILPDKKPNPDEVEE
jgi:hypothetical protein